MDKKWLLINALLLAGIIYLKYFNQMSNHFIYNYNFLKAVSSFLVFYLTITMLSQIAKYVYSKKLRIPKDEKNNVYFGIENIARFTIGIGLFLFLLSAFGIDPREFITSMTIVAAAIAILTKEYIVDYLSGLYLS